MDVENRVERHSAEPTAGAPKTEPEVIPGSRAPVATPQSIRMLGAHLDLPMLPVQTKTDCVVSASDLEDSAPRGDQTSTIVVAVG